MAYYGKSPPRGYRSSEFPLPHDFSYDMKLTAEDEVQNTAMLTLIRATDLATNIDTVVVNPKHASFAEETGTSIAMDSIIPKIKFSLRINLTKAAIETDKMRSAHLVWYPVYNAFKDMMDAIDLESGLTYGALAGVEDSGGSHDAQYIASGTNFTAADVMPMNTVLFTEVFGDHGLSVNTALESFALDQNNLFDAMKYGTIRGLLRKGIGKMHHVTVGIDKPYHYFSNNFTNPTVKRGNPFTFCGVVVHLFMGSTPDQYFNTDDTTDIGHVNVGARVNYDEWNPHFDQTPF